VAVKERDARTAWQKCLLSRNRFFANAVKIMNLAVTNLEKKRAKLYDALIFLLVVGLFLLCGAAVFFLLCC
jgi:hypothetical protein